jgi:hypothetical protein
MPAGEKLPTFSIAMAAWRDVLRALGLMGTTFVVAIVAMIPVNFLQIYLVPRTPGGPSGLMSHLWFLAYAVAQAFVLTPLLVAVHRFVLLKETTSYCRFLMPNRRLRRFFDWMAAMSALMAIPQFLFDPGIVSGELLRVFSLASGIFLLSFLLTNYVRLSILFPSIAIDAPGADWLNAIDDAKGHFWRMFLVIMCTLAPSLIALGIVTKIADPSGSLIERIIAAVGISVVGVLSMAALAAMASHIYAAVADRLTRPTDQTTFASPRI